jgi:hypothetical protein
MKTLVLLTLMLAISAGPQPAQRTQETPVIVELFTSEGCESCPPADVLLQQLAASQPVAAAKIIPLGLHVDYWDQLGWKDRFSSPAYTNRQRTYGARLNTDDIYTPQMIVDGRTQFVGSDAAAARQAVTKASTAVHGVIRIDRRGNDLTISASDLPNHDRADIVVAVTEDGLQSKVTRGENHGRTLTHTAVVRSLNIVGEASGRAAEARTTLTMDPSWKPDALHVVAFVQERRGGAILAAGTLGAASR